jgi:hypothetical protein
LDAPLPSPAPAPVYAVAPGDIYPRSSREEELCAKASRPDYLYLGGLVAVDVAATWFGTYYNVKYSDSVALRAIVSPGVIGVTWGATISGAFLSFPKCNPHWVGETPLEGDVRTDWPLAIALALLAGATAPIWYGTVIGYNLQFNDIAPSPGDPNPPMWSTPEREAHLVVAGVAGFGGALLPYLFPPSTVRAARELNRLRFGYDGRSGYFGYGGTF